MDANTFTRWTVMVAALVSTAYAEHHLGVWIGWNPWVASVIPAVSDLYLIYATRTGRDVAPAVSVVIGLSAANYICTAPLDPVRTSLSVAVSALAPLVLWRLHASEHKEEHVAPLDEVEEKVIAPLAEKRQELIWDVKPEPVVEPEPEPEPEPDPTPARLSDTEAKRMAEYAFTSGVKASDAVDSVTRSKATVYRWYKEFEADGVKKLASA